MFFGLISRKENRKKVSDLKEDQFQKENFNVASSIIFLIDKENQNSHALLFRPHARFSLVHPFEKPKIASRINC